MKMGTILNMLIQYGLPGLALLVSGYFGARSVIATAKAQKESETAGQKLTAQTATEERLQSLLDEQRKQFITPLQEELEKVQGQVAQLQVAVEKEKDEKWDALGYVRTLINWINLHIRSDSERVPLPEPPESIKSHVGRWTYPTSPPTPYEQS